ncbi:MAG: ribonuclease HII [Alphaproteobacteria bacterium]
MTPNRPDNSREKEMFNAGYQIIAGVDEVGRGPLAGSVIAAAVTMDWQQVPEEFSLLVNDSKKMTAKARIKLVQLLQEMADSAIGEATVNEIDQLNIRQASLLAMQRAVAKLKKQPQMVLVDGRDIPILPMAATAIIGGDRKCMSIAAASVIAKETRDLMMLELDRDYPLYGFARHKGYPTAFHREALQRHGVSPVHRKTFAPVARLIPLFQPKKEN